MVVQALGGSVGKPQHTAAAAAAAAVVTGDLAVNGGGVDVRLLQQQQVLLRACSYAAVLRKWAWQGCCWGRCCCRCCHWYVPALAVC
eukprot:1156788-Pelagomonas_calceolata.AAC.5